MTAQDFADRIAAALRLIAPTGDIAPNEVPLINALAASIAARMPAGRRTSLAAVTMIKEFEGVRLTAYPDPATGAAPWTIGVGHTGPEVRPGLTWTMAQVDAALSKDIGRFERGVSVLVEGCETSQCEFDALVSFAFNLGLGNLEGSTLLKMHRAGDHVGAAGQFGHWINAGGKPMEGLRRRRAAEARLYRGQP